MAQAPKKPAKNTGRSPSKAILDAVDSAEERPAPPDDSELARELLNDLGNARRLIARFGRDLSFVQEWGWGGWDGQRWRFDDGDHRALKRAHETAEAIFEEAAALPDFLEPEPDKSTNKAAWEKWERRRKWHRATETDLKDFALASGNAGAAGAMLRSAAPYLAEKTDAFDRDPFRLNVANGTLHFDGARVRLYPWRWSDRMTKSATAVYDPEADCPKWQQFMGDIFPNADATALLVQKWLGYCLTGSIEEQKMVIFEGPGSNGKSTMMTVVAEILGDYACTTPVETFLHNDRKSGSGPSPDIARLPGARLVRTSEPEVGSRLSESVIKQWTGGEKMTTRELHKAFFEFKPTGKVVMSVNQRPVIVGKDHGIKRRILVIPFTRIFTRAERAARVAAIDPEVVKNRPDEAIEADLLEEASGILNWLLDGYRLWRDDGGLTTPEAVTAATDAYFAEMDPIGQFIRECCKSVSDGEGVTADAREKAALLYQVYKKWCDQASEDPKNQTSFGRRLSDMGIKGKKSHGVGYRMGISIRNEWLPEATPTFGDD